LVIAIHPPNPNGVGVAMPSMVKTIYGYKTDAISIEDDY